MMFLCAQKREVAFVCRVRCLFRECITSGMLQWNFYPFGQVFQSHSGPPLETTWYIPQIRAQCGVRTTYHEEVSHNAAVEVGDRNTQTLLKSRSQWLNELRWRLHINVLKMRSRYMESLKAVWSSCSTLLRPWCTCALAPKSFIPSSDQHRCHGNWAEVSFYGNPKHYNNDWEE